MDNSMSTINITSINQGFSRMWQDVAISPLDGQSVQYD
jgi:hypothetical protein